eukprot:4092340-Prymnesium_polylepis.1
MQVMWCAPRDAGHVVCPTRCRSCGVPHVMQVMWWIERLRGRVAPGHAPPSYGLLGKKLSYGVDYGNYMHQ